jgi:hypothetical protein
VTPLTLALTRPRGALFGPARGTGNLAPNKFTFAHSVFFGPFSSIRQMTQIIIFSREHERGSNIHFVVLLVVLVVLVLVGALLKFSKRTLGGATDLLKILLSF